MKINAEVSSLGVPGYFNQEGGGADYAHLITTGV